MLYDLIKNTTLNVPPRNESINWRDIRFLIRVISIVYIVMPIYKIIEWLIIKIYRYDTTLYSKHATWDSTYDYIYFYNNNDKLKAWLKKNDIGYFQLIDDVRLGNLRFYFKREEDAMAFKLRWV